MGKNSNKKSNLLHLLCFILFVVWGVGTLANILLSGVGFYANVAGLVENILRICAVLVMAYCGFLYYSQNKENKFVFILFWISVLVVIAVVVLPFLNISF